ncbi:MAG: 2OG-Fe(II) oxygenase family protein [Pseudomonadota bacterium]|nr:2OG-Fe(II) oxygenase family protein [Pseudomonadota bacterium]
MSKPFSLNFQMKGPIQQPATAQPSLTLYKLFPTVIWDVELTQFADSLQLWKREILQLRDADPQSATRSTRLGWSSQDRSVLDGGVFGPLKVEVSHLISGVLQHMAGEEVPFKLESWINLHDRGGLNQLHMHEHALLSGVFYLSVPDGSGPLMFRDPRPGVLHSPFRSEGPNACKVISLPPRAGLLVLFPHWLEHSVEPHDGAEPRIAIGLNAARN